jgi:hypothetical protein
MAQVLQCLVFISLRLEIVANLGSSKWGRRVCCDLSTALSCDRANQNTSDNAQCSALLTAYAPLCLNLFGDINCLGRCRSLLICAVRIF